MRQGRAPGIYESWAECYKQTGNYSGAVFKSFETLEAAQEYLQDAPGDPIINENLPHAYIDGSFSKKNSCYGYGGFIFTGKTYYIIQGTGDAADYLQYRNITGEIRGALEVIKQALQLGITEINLFYDYAGIEKWATGEWACKTQLSQFYREYYQKRRNRLTVHFVGVKGHTGIEGNEIADLLAKEAAGVQLRKKDIAALQTFKEKAAHDPPQKQEN